MPELIQRLASRLIHRRFPFAKEQAEDLSSEVLLRILEHQRLLVPETIHHLQSLERRLNEVVRNALIDVLRHHRLITRLKCGACQHFGELSSGSEGCLHPRYLSNAEDADEHPHCGQALDSQTDPKKLDPPCKSFAWHKPSEEDLIEEAFAGGSGDLTQRQRALKLLLRGIDRMAQEDLLGMKAASTMFWHYFGGRSVGRLATDHAVSEKTIKRQLAEGRRRLERVLREEFGVTELDELE